MSGCVVPMQQCRYRRGSEKERISGPLATTVELRLRFGEIRGIVVREQVTMDGKKSESADDLFATQSPGSREPVASSKSASLDSVAEFSGSFSATAGQRLHAYELLEKLGEGGMGAVWKARHCKLDKLVALKLLRAPLTSEPETIRRFEREMRAVGKVDHPNIVRALDAGEVHGLHYLVMEYVDGIDLSKYIAQHGPLSVSDVCVILQQTAMGLAAAHAEGLIHRDIKPANLLLSTHGQIKILDLGLAKLLAEGPEVRKLTQMGQVFGTPDFMAPEQWDDTHNVDYRADIYSLGCTMYALLTGRAPFDDDRHATLTQKMRAHVMENHPRPSEARSEVPQELEDLYLQMVEKDVNKRVTSAAEVAEQLRMLAQGFSTMKVNLIDHDTVTAECASVSGAASADPARYATVSQEKQAEPPRTQTAAAPPRRVMPKWVLAAAGGAMALVLLGVIIIKVINKDGSLTELRVPDNAAAIEIEKDGKPLGKIDVVQGTISPPDAHSAEPKMAASDSASKANSRAAEWLLSIKAPFDIRMVDGGTRQVRSRADLPSDHFEIVSIEFSSLGDSVTDDGLAHLQGLTSLEYVSLNMCSKITDVGISHLASCSALQIANLAFVQVTDQGVGALLKLQNLNRLDLSETYVGDSGLSQLAPLTKLRWINVGPLTTDAGLAHLTRFPDLEHVGIKNHHATDIGVSHLRQLPKLRSLYLVGASDLELQNIRSLSNLQTLNLNMNTITRAGMEQLRGFPDLLNLYLPSSPLVVDEYLQDTSCIAHVQVLYLERTNIGDAGLASLSALTDLQELNVTSTNVTSAGVEQLHRKLPKCEIRWDGGVVDGEHP